jgi:uncharacterized protein YjbI with pentapeptide repeats
MPARMIAWWLLAAGIAILAFYWYPDTWAAHVFISGYYGALSASLIAISITVLLIDHANEQRDERRRKSQLIREMGSADNGFAVRAAKELRELGSLEDGTLDNGQLRIANLQWADLSKARLMAADLFRATLVEADLSGTDLRHANLKRVKGIEVILREAKIGGADLKYAQLDGAVLERVKGAPAKVVSATGEETGDEKKVDMLGAVLIGANLRSAVLKNASLEGCDLGLADLTRCDLSEANLRGAQVKGAIFENADLTRATLSGLKEWQKIAVIRGAQIGGVIDPPDGFTEWAIEGGAIVSALRESPSGAMATPG